MAEGGHADEKRDMLDDIIDIQRDLQAVSNPLDSVTSALLQQDTAPTWDPAKFKERPRANATKCIRCITGISNVCNACIDVCPVDAISIHEAKIEILENCRMCGLCVAECPCEAIFDVRHTARKLYDEVARKAAAHNTCYITCTRALGRLPEENEVVLPCVGALGEEALFALLVEYPNLAVYLPLGICDRCRTTTGEAVYVEHIGAAEAQVGRSVDLEMDPDNLDHAKKRSYERSEFVGSIVRGGQAMLAASNPMLAGAAAITKKISEHTRQINELERTLSKVVGANNTQKKRRALTQKRQLVLSALQKAPFLAERLEAEVPVCDSSKCTICGECARVCPFNACDIDDSGRFSVAVPYCIGCRGCVEACPDGALTMQVCDAEDLLVPDEVAQTQRLREEARREEIARLKEEGRKRFQQGLDILEKFAETSDEVEAEQVAANKADS